MKPIYFDIITIGIFGCLNLLLNTISFTRSRWFNLVVSSILVLAVYFLMEKYAAQFLQVSLQEYNFEIGLITLVGIFYNYFFGGKTLSSEPTGKNHGSIFHLELANGGKITFSDPFDNFLVYGGANAGKTKSIGKPLLEQYIKNDFAGLIYDYKDFDYTKTAYSLIQKHGYKKPFFHVSFTDMERTYRFNPIKPSVIEDESFLIQLMDDVLGACLGEGSEKDEWYYGALGILRGAAFRFFKDFPEYCTLPHIVNSIIHSDRKKLCDFLSASPESKALASAYLDSLGSDATRASILSTLTNYISALAFDKNIAYVLTGDDFNFNLIDPLEPKLVAVSNSYKLENSISPIIALMINVSSRHFSMKNKIPFVYFWDEATTFKIRDFEKMPSVLREYLCSFVFLTQSGAKIEKNYGRLDRSSIESNFSNLFLGRTKDTEALKNYGMLFSKKKETKRTDTSNSRDNYSVSLSKVDKDKYEASFFTGLKAGEFVGSASHSNFGEFHLKLKQYRGVDVEEMPLVKKLYKGDIERNYQEIIRTVKYIVESNVSTQVLGSVGV